MERCLLNYYVLNNELRDSCEFNPGLFEETPSVYEVIRVEEGIPLFLHDHITRFYNSLNLAGITCNLTEKQIKNSIKALIETNSMQVGLVKFVFAIHPDSGSLFAAWVTPFLFPSEHTHKTGIKMVSYQGSRQNPNAKISHQAVRQQADKLIKQNNVYEVLLLNAEGIITEGSRSNLFFVKDGILFTAHPSFILNGVTRQKIINLALESGIDVFESAFKLNEIGGFEATFITGTTPKVLSVNTIDATVYKVQHPVVQHLTLKYNRLIADYIKNFSWE